jgi:hypothetical protein
MQVESAIFFETTEEIYARVFRYLKPRTACPQVTVEFCPFANANSSVRFEGNRLQVRITDLLRDAPAPVTEALAWILLCKLFRKPVPAAYSHKYRLYLNRRDLRERLERLRRERGRKFRSGSQGEVYNLEEVFEDLNFRYFHGLMARPDLGWSRRPSRTLLGHYDPHHHTIVLSKALDQRGVPRLAVEYVMFHEMLHLRHPVQHRGTRRCVHTPEFKIAEKEFQGLKEAKDLLKRL